VRISKTLSWLLRHGAQGEGLKMRTDGYVKVDDLLQNPKLKAQHLTLKMVKEIVRLDSKQRYDLILENAEGSSVAVDLNATSSDAVDALWWIKARQGHSIKTVQLELKPITSIEDIPSRVAVHGTNLQAWSSIRTYPQRSPTY
jgi:2'-phosphotransferase